MVIKSIQLNFFVFRFVYITGYIIKYVNVIRSWPWMRQWKLRRTIHDSWGHLIMTSSIYGRRWRNRDPLSIILWFWVHDLKKPSQKHPGYPPSRSPTSRSSKIHFLSKRWLERHILRSHLLQMQIILIRRVTEPETQAVINS